MAERGNICSKCKAENELGNKFCYKCGSPILASEKSEDNNIQESESNEDVISAIEGGNKVLFKRHRVFISYANPDKETADIICGILESQGIQCWIAPRDVIPGEKYAKEIIDGIEESQVFVLIFSSNALSSHHVSSEVDRAFCKKIPIIAFRIENILPTEEMEYYLGNKHWLDAFTPPMENHGKKLALTIQRLLDSQSSIKPSNRTTGISSCISMKRKVKPIIIILAILVVGLALSLFIMFRSHISHVQNSTAKIRIKYLYVKTDVILDKIMQGDYQKELSLNGRSYIIQNSVMSELKDIYDRFFISQARNFLSIGKEDLEKYPLKKGRAKEIYLKAYREIAREMGIYSVECHSPVKVPKSLLSKQDQIRQEDPLSFDLISNNEISDIVSQLSFMGCGPNGSLNLRPLYFTVVDIENIGESSLSNLEIKVVTNTPENKMKIRLENEQKGFSLSGKEQIIKFSINTLTAGEHILVPAEIFLGPLYGLDRYGLTPENKAKTQEKLILVCGKSQPSRKPYGLYSVVSDVSDSLRFSDKEYERPLFMGSASHVEEITFSGPTGEKITEKVRKPSKDLVFISEYTACGSCPHIYSWDSGNSVWKPLGTILYGFSSKEKENTEKKEISGLSERLLISEEETELSYIDYLAISIKLTSGKTLILASKDCPEVIKADGIYLKLKHGENLELKFDLPKSENIAAIEVISKGYYVPEK